MNSEKQPPGQEGAQRGADVYDLLAWLEVNKKQLGIAAAVLIVIGFVFATVHYMREQKEASASADLLALRPTLTPSTNVPPPQASALMKVAQDHPGTSAAERARLLAATTLFSEGKYAEAEKEFAQFVKDHSSSPWVAEAAYGIATSQEAQNKLNEAQASYQNVATAYANSSVADDAKLSLARIYELRKQPDQALRIYNELLAPKPGTQPGEMGNRDAFQRKEALLRDHPELNTNVVAALPPPAATVSVPMTNAPQTAPTSTPAAKPVATNTPPAK